MSRQPDFFTETAVTPDQKVEKSIPRWEINGHAEGYKWAIDQLGSYGKNWIFGPKTEILGPKKRITS